jgi:RND superfamily putative drug exporter
VLAILGPAAFWSPRRLTSAEAGDAAAAVEAAEAAESAAKVEAAANGKGSAKPEAPAEPAPSWWTRLLTLPVFSAVILVVCAMGLIAAALPARHLSLGVSFVEALPSDHPARLAAVQSQIGFAKGILSPTELLVQAPGVATRKDQLTKLQDSLRQVPGVAAVVGPGDGAIPTQLNLFQSPDNDAARYLLVLADEPLGARAVRTVSRLQDQLPDLVAAAGLTGVDASLGGDTAVATAVVDRTVDDLGRIAAAALIANLLFLMLYLRALIVPIGLLACSVLAIAATLGLTTWLFQDVLGHDGLTFYVPFAAAVLLVALGSDYNIFGVGPAWKEARGRPLREALAITLPQSSRAIRTAAITLAVTFGLLALVPLRPFRELAFALSVGVLVDAFVVRSLLAPALLSVIDYVREAPARHPSRGPAYVPSEDAGAR